MQKPYRDCIVAVIRREDGSLLAGERADHLGSWQLPQGGMEAGESYVEALKRELKEEIGTDQIQILQRLSGWIKYDFPASMTEGPAKLYRGQQQAWFLIELLPHIVPDLAVSDGEFKSLCWMSPKSLLEGIVPWKQGAYKQGLKAFGLI